GPADPVCYVSPRDALAFCQWTNTRLPTDEEWLAAAMHPQDAVDAKQYFGAVEELRRSPEWRRVTFNTSEIVTTQDSGFGARHGPKYVRCSSDENRRMLFPIAESFYSLDVGFRVVGVDEGRKES
ncbi:MAG: SUMF1/EgtB/PvdO family nonheme iron enzyme, partial [Aureliella sp.]